MQYLLGHFWMWGLGALALGIVIGFSFARRKPGQTPAQGQGWLLLYAAVLALGVALAALKAVKGLNGLWFESLVGLAIAYVVGCLIGALVHGEGQQGDLALAGATVATGAGASAEDLALRAEALARSTQEAMAQEDGAGAARGEVPTSKST